MLSSRAFMGVRAVLVLVGMALALAEHTPQIWWLAWILAVQVVSLAHAWGEHTLLDQIDESAFWTLLLTLAPAPAPAPAPIQLVTPAHPRARRSATPNR